MSDKEKEECTNAIRDISYHTMKLENPYDRVRVCEWIRKLSSLGERNSEVIRKKNEYLQLLKIQVTFGILTPPFSKPPPDTDLSPLAELLGNIMCDKNPNLQRAGPIAPTIVHKSPDGRAYVSVRKVPGNGVFCYMAVTPDSFDK